MFILFNFFVLIWIFLNTISNCNYLYIIECWFVSDFKKINIDQVIIDKYCPSEYWTIQTFHLVSIVEFFLSYISFKLSKLIEQTKRIKI